MRIRTCRHLFVAVIAACGLNSAAAQSKTDAKLETGKPDNAKPATAKPEAEKLDPNGRPEGALYDQSARYYLFYEKDAWHLHTTARQTRTFSGTIRVTGAKIASCVPIGLKHDTKQKISDAWQVNEARDELQFNFHTGRAADGLELAVKGDDGTIEFDLKIDDQTGPKTIFIGREKNHPAKSPFVLPAKPKATDLKQKS